MGGGEGGEKEEEEEEELKRRRRRGRRRRRRRRRSKEAENSTCGTFLYDVRVDLLKSEFGVLSKMKRLHHSRHQHLSTHDQHQNKKSTCSRKLEKMGLLNLLFQLFLYRVNITIEAKRSSIYYFYESLVTTTFYVIVGNIVNIRDDIYRYWN